MIRTLLAGLAVLVLTALPVEALAWTNVTDFVPPANVAASAAPGPFTANKYSDVAGSVWSTNAAGQLVSASTTTPWQQGVLLNTSTGADAAISQRISASFVYNTSGSTIWLGLHGTTPGTSTTSGYIAGVTGSTGGATISFNYVKAGAVSTLNGGSNFAGLTAGQTYTLIFQVTELVSKTTLLRADVYNAAGNVLGELLSTDTTTANSLQTATKAFLFEYLAGTGNAAMPITELKTDSYNAAVATAFSSSGTLNSNPILSPANWDDVPSGTYGFTQDEVETASPGAYLKLSFTGSQVGLAFDVSSYSGFGGTAAYLRYSIDNSVPGYTALSSGYAQPVMFSSNLPFGAHTLRLWLESTNPSNGTRYSTSTSTAPTNVLRLVSVYLDTTSSLTPYTFAGYIAPTCKAVMKGDSITEAQYAASYYTGTSTNTQWPYSQNLSTVNSGNYATYGWAAQLGQMLGCEYGQIGYGYSGVLVTTGSGTSYASEVSYGAGTSTDTYGWGADFSSGRARPTDSSMSYVFEDGMTNEGLQFGGTNQYGAVINSTNAQAMEVRAITQDRTLYPAAWIFVVTPPGGYERSDLDASVQTYKAANPSDAKVARIDVSTVLPTLGFVNGDPGCCVNSYDGTHPLAPYHALYAGAIALVVEKILASAATTCSGSRSCAMNTGAVIAP